MIEIKRPTQKDQLIFESLVMFEMFNSVRLKSLAIGREELCSVNAIEGFARDHIVEFGVDCQGTLVLSLYLLLVVPFEASEKICQKEYQEFDKWFSSICTVHGRGGAVAGGAKQKFAKHLRDAVAHLFVRFVEKDSVFFDNGNNKAPVTLQLPLARVPEVLDRLRQIVLAYFHHRSAQDQ